MRHSIPLPCEINTKEMRVLIADDSALIRERLEKVFSGIDQVEVVGCLENGPDSLKALRTLTPDLAVLDIQMPGISGLELVRKIRKENQSIIFIILTLQSQGYIKQLAIQAGSNYFFNKVDDLEKLVEVVTDLSKTKNNNHKI